MGEVAGYVLPIKRASYGNQPGWMSGAWFLRDDDTLWLIPGDSPMGLRLPLDSIPWVAEKEYPVALATGSLQSEIAGIAERNFPISAQTGNDRPKILARARRAGACRLWPRPARATTRRTGRRAGRIAAAAAGI